MNASVTAVTRELVRLGLNQMEISRRTQIPQPRLSRWMAGQAPRTADDAIKLRALLDETLRAQGESPAAEATNQPLGGDQAEELVRKT